MPCLLMRGAGAVPEGDMQHAALLREEERGAICASIILCMRIEMRADAEDVLQQPTSKMAPLSSPHAASFRGAIFFFFSLACFC